MVRSHTSFLDDIPVDCKNLCDYTRTGTVWHLIVEPQTIVQAAKAMYENGFFLEDVTAVDVEEGYLLDYHFDHWDKPGRITVKVILERDNPVIDSICSIFQGAEWHERECMDFFRLTFKGNPNPAPLLLPVETDEKPLEREEGSRASLLTIVPFCRLVDFPPDHPVVIAHRETESQDNDQPKTKSVPREDA